MTLVKNRSNNFIDLFIVDRFKLRKLYECKFGKISVTVSFATLLICNVT